MLGPLFETLVLGQMIRALANKGKAASIYFYRDHLGHEVDFLIPVGEKLKLFECKWSESVSPDQKGFDAIGKAAGSRNIVSRNIVTPLTGRRHLNKDAVLVRDCIDFEDL